jgi:serine phosphatase RsbU (regulator of sigma subunit)
MITTTKLPRRDDLAAARDVKRRPFVGRSDANSEPRLNVECSTATWSISGPATSGGDVADSFTLSNECIVVAVWDAAGHGKTAATDAVLVRAQLRALLSADPDILSAVFALNRLLFRRAGTLPSWPFVSGFFGLVNRETHTLRYISCGHETALMFRGRSAHVHLPHNGPLLGISEAADLTVDAVHVERGDRLVIVSNGITDARPLCSQTEFFGTARLCSYFRSQPSGCAADALRLIDHVVTFADEALDDDAAALIARFE